MKRIPTFVSDDNGSIIHIIKKTIKNYSSMKAMHLIIAMLVMMSLASCSADGNDPVENSVSTYLLEKTYGARSVTYEENNSDKLKLSELPAISLSFLKPTIFYLSYENILMLKKNLIFKLPPKENKHGLEL